MARSTSSSRRRRERRRRTCGGSVSAAPASLLLLLLAFVCSTSAGFSPSRAFAAFRRRSSSAPGVPASASSSVVATVSSTPPSWEELASSLERENRKEKDDEPEPVLTLYRDTNGWCPFCERVWLCLEAKGLPYRTRLVSLQDKPEWYKELVPTSLVPAVLIHDERTTSSSSSAEDRDQEEEEEEEKKGKSKPQRRLVWESIDVMEALDESFPDTPRLVLDTPEYLAARERATALSDAGVRYVYAGRNGALTEEDIAERREAFLSRLDEVEESLSSHGGPFLLGSDFTGADAEIVPLLERWRYQLPLTNNIDILEGRPSLRRWFDAMDGFGPYGNRVSGDAYSWAAVSSTFMRYFGGNPDENPEAKELIDRADAYAEALAASFGDVSDDDDDDDDVDAGEKEAKVAAAREAAIKLISNSEAVVKDCTDADPKSQKEVPRSTTSEDAVMAADVALRYVASILLSSEGSVLKTSREGPLPVEVSSEENRDAAASALRTVARRLCVPRDMGAPAARILRGALAVVAERLEGEERDDDDDGGARED